jgi:hypothetical protein
VGLAVVPLPAFTQSRAIPGPPVTGSEWRGGHLTMGRAPNPERSGPDSIDIAHQFETGEERILQSATPALTARTIARGCRLSSARGAGRCALTHKIGPIELNCLTPAEPSAMVYACAS